VWFGTGSIRYRLVSRIWYSYRAKPTLFITAPLVEHLAERHPTFRAFIIADIDPIFVSIIVSCRFATTLVDQPVAQPLRQSVRKRLRFRIGDDLQTSGPDLLPDHPWLLPMRGRAQTA
jgi:hypothetical protein